MANWRTGRRRRRYRLTSSGKKKVAPLRANGLNSFKRCGSLRRWPVPDWNKVIHDHLGGLDLQADERAEIVEELAGIWKRYFTTCGGKGFPKKTPRADVS